MPLTFAWLLAAATHYGVQLLGAATWQPRVDGFGYAAAAVTGGRASVAPLDIVAAELTAQAVFPSARTGTQAISVHSTAVQIDATAFVRAPIAVGRLRLLPGAVFGGGLQLLPTTLSLQGQTHSQLGLQGVAVSGLACALEVAHVVTRIDLALDIPLTANGIAHTALRLGLAAGAVF